MQARGRAVHLANASATALHVDDAHELIEHQELKAKQYRLAGELLINFGRVDRHLRRCDAGVAQITSDYGLAGLARDLLDLCSWSYQHSAKLR